MNHIPQATGSPHQTIRVPFLVTDEFEPLVSKHNNTSADWMEEEDSSEPTLLVTFDDNEDRPAQTLATLNEILAFYQARCFFGLLFDLYTLSERRFDLEIYLESHNEDSAVVSTRNLLEELQEIEDHEKSLSDDAKTAKFISLDSSIQETENLTVFLQSLVVRRSQMGGKDVSFLPKDLWDTQIVTESAAMLRETLVSAARQIYMPATISTGMEPLFGRELPPAPENILCRDRFKKAGWCPWYAAEAEETSLKSRSILFALSSIDRNISRRIGQSHDRCSIKECIWDNIDDTYQTRHIPNCENVEACPMVPTEDSKNKSQNASTIIANIVRKGNIPAINIVHKADSAPSLSIKGYRLGQRSGPNLRKRKRTRLEAGKFELGQMPYTEKIVKLCDHAFTLKRKHDEGAEEYMTSCAMMRLLEERRAVGVEDKAEECLPYIAISHVWSQGLGNRHNNTIWLCQLERLQQYANRLVPPAHRPVPMWIDTLCVPLEADARMEAIKTMDAVYQSALAVLVVDQTLIDFDLASAMEQCKEEDGGARSGPESWQIEMLMRIKASPWAQRLWTYNEAFLAQQLFFQTGYKGRSGLPGIWSQDILAPLKGDSIAHMFVPDRDVDDEDRTLINAIIAAATRNTPTKAWEGTPPDDVEMESPLNVPKSEHRAFPLEYTAGYLLTEAASLQLFGGKYSPYRSNIPDFYEDLRYLSRQLAVRTTSHLNDEAICLSTLLGLGPEKVLFDAEGRKIAPENRMKTLWEVLAPERIPAEVLFCNRPIYGQKGLGWMPRNLSRDKSGNWINHLGCKDILRKSPEEGILVQMGGLQFEIPHTTGRGAEADGDSSLWDVVLQVSGFRYRILAAEASESWPAWRLSTHCGNFAVLMPPSELEVLLKSTEDRFEGSGSHSTELPFGLLVNMIEEPQPKNASAIDPASSMVSNSKADVFHVARREMVEFEAIPDEEGSHDSEASSSTVEVAAEAGTPVEVDCDSEDEQGSSQLEIHPGEAILPDILPETQKWWVG